MPPRAKYSREQIIQAGLELVREQGIESLVARELGKKLGTSSSPIFTAFESMQEVQNEVRRATVDFYNAYVSDCLAYKPAFKAFGMRTIQFAREEPKLFQLLYMQENDRSQSFEEMFDELGKAVPVCIEIIQRDYHLEEQEAKALFQQVWVYTFGIANLCAAKVCNFNEDEIAQLLGRAFTGMLLLIQSGEMALCDIQPAIAEHGKRDRLGD